MIAAFTFTVSCLQEFEQRVMADKIIRYNEVRDHGVTCPAKQDRIVPFLYKHFYHLSAEDDDSILCWIHREISELRIISRKHQNVYRPCQTCLFQLKHWNEPPRLMLYPFIGRFQKREASYYMNRIDRALSVPCHKIFKSGNRHSNSTTGEARQTAIKNIFHQWNTHHGRASSLRHYQCSKSIQKLSYMSPRKRLKSIDDKNLNPIRGSFKIQPDPNLHTKVNAQNH